MNLNYPFEHPLVYKKKYIIYVSEAQADTGYSLGPSGLASFVCLLTRLTWYPSHKSPLCPRGPKKTVLFHLPSVIPTFPFCIIASQNWPQLAILWAHTLSCHRRPAEGLSAPSASSRNPSSPWLWLPLSGPHSHSRTVDRDWQRLYG